MRLNVYCDACKHKLLNKSLDNPCRVCTATHVYCNYFYFEHAGCEHCNEGTKIGDEFYVDVSGNLLKGGYDDIEINYCPICGRKLK